MDRGDFSDWGDELGDGDFAASLAALGALLAAGAVPVGAAGILAALRAAISRLPADNQSGVGIATLKIAAPWVGTDRPRPNAKAFADAWDDLHSSLNDPLRLSVTGDMGTNAQVTLARILAHDRVGADSIVAERAFRNDGRTEWRLPVSFGYLQGDALARARFLKERPHWPHVLRRINRAQPNSGILVLRAPIAAAAAKLLQLQAPIRAGMVLLVGADGEDAVQSAPAIDFITSSVNASAFAFVPDVGDQLPVKLEAFGEELSHNVPVDRALWSSFGTKPLTFMSPDFASTRLANVVEDLEVRLEELGPTSIALPPTVAARLSLPSGAEAGEIAQRITHAKSHFGYHFESGEATGLTELTTVVSAKEKEQGKATPRFVERKKNPPDKGYVVNLAAREIIRIAPAGDESWQTVRDAIDEAALPPVKGSRKMQLVFEAPDIEPMRRDITLPKSGASNEVRFVFTPKKVGQFSARLTLLYRGRVLQRLSLNARVAKTVAALERSAGNITLAVENVVRGDWSDLGGRSQFDLAIIADAHEDAEAGRAIPRASIIAKRHAYATDIDGVSQMVSEINAALSDVAHDVAPYSKGLSAGENPALLTTLARKGRIIYEALFDGQLRETGAANSFDPEAVEYIQIVSARRDAVLPLEFCYDRQAPNPQAKVCPQHRQALSASACPASCKGMADQRAFVCPMGFWGLRKVIERHEFSAVNVLPAGAPFVVQSEPAAGRDRIAIGAGAVVGHSAIVKAASVRPLVTRLAGGAERAVRAKDWNDWRAIVRARQPGLLIAYPHNDGQSDLISLEIGKQAIKTLNLEIDYVRKDESAPSPLVILLGCDVAGTDQAMATHVSNFRRAGAGVVVATIATVFGEHAPKVGAAIANALMEANSEEGVRLGEALRNAKRAALLESLPMALCVVAFGDADWIVDARVGGDA